MSMNYYYKLCLMMYFYNQFFKEDKMKKYRKLINGEKVKELDSSINLIIKTKCPEKWIIKDLETGQSYRANGQTELGKMFTPIND